MVTQMLVEVGRNVGCLFDYVASLWAAYTHTLHVGGRALIFAHVFALDKVNPYVWCGMSVYAYECLYFGCVYVKVQTHSCRCGWDQCV